jgi:hypothetical protein
MSPPDPPADVPALPPRPSDPNAKRLTMRQMMIEHRVRPDCVQCHRLMDPIGFALEGFDGIGLQRTQDAGQPVDLKGVVFDSTEIEGPAALRAWIVKGYSRQFLAVATEKLLTYALGRGVEYRDMPLVRAIARDASRDGGRFSSVVLGIVKSRPFQMNVSDGAAAQTASTR